MKRLVALCLLLSACTTVSPRNEFAAQRSGPEVRDVPYQARNTDASPRKRVLVLPFIDEGASRSEKAAMYARDALIRSMLKSDNFVVLSNADFPKDVSQFYKKGEYDLEAMAKLANSIGLSAIVEGKILEVKAKRIGDAVGIVREVRARLEATVQLRVLATKNTHMVLSEVKSATIEDSTMRIAERPGGDRYLEEDPVLLEAVVTKAFASLIPKIGKSVEKLQWEGRIAMVKGDRIFVNAGRLSGIQVGDILKISEEGEDVYDPDSGALIGRVPGRLKGTVEVVSYFGKDGAIGVIHSGAGFRENDLVELY